MRFSVIMPAFDPPVEKFSASVASVCSQEFDNWELIIINDGSQEPKFLKDLEDASSTDSRIRIVHQKNSGVSSARNRGTQAATGDYVMYLDADDELTPHALLDADSTLSDHPVDALLAYVQNVKKEADKTQLRTSELKILTPQDKSELFAATLAGNASSVAPPVGSFRVKIGPVARMIRRELALRTPFPENVSISEDTLWSLAVLDSASTVSVLQSNWYWYWTDHGSASRSYRPAAFDETLKLLGELSRVTKNAATPFDRPNLTARVLGEVNRAVALFYANRKCPLPWAVRRNQVQQLLRQEGTYVGLGEASKAGPKNLAKYLLLNSGAILSPYTYRW